MSKTTEIREICGDYAFDVEHSADNTFTMFFNSRRNAMTVKRCIEVDDSVPNVATAVDFVEVVRCKDCMHHDDCICVVCEEENTVVCKKMSRHFPKEHFCSYGERKESKR